MAEPARTMIRIYPSFTEIREDVEATSPHKVYIPEDLYNNIMQGSLNLEGVNVQTMDAVLRENNLEGKEIHVLKNKELRKVKMIRSRDSLVQDLETKRYFNVDRSQIEFTEVPEETGHEITFVFDKKGPAVLSYLMYGISWKPRYMLNVHGDANTFQGWADIKNNTIKEYTIDQTELFGDVAIRRVNEYQPRVMMMKASRVMADSVATVQAEGEVAGLYMYTIKNAYVLAPRSTFSLPFASPKIELKKVALMNSYFNQSNSKGQSERIYKIVSNEFLPSGTVTVREDGRVVGQSSINNLSADEKADLAVGNDPEISYEREVKTILHKEEMSQYEVTVTIKSRKNRSINYEFYERFHGRFEVESLSNNLKIENDYVKTEGTLNQKEEKSIKFGVKFYYK